MFKGAKPQMMRGLLLLESLADTRVLDHIHVTRTETWQVKNAEPYQPPVWTAISFEADDRQGEVITNAFSQALKQGWCINALTETHVYVVFPDRVFKYGKGDASQREAVKAFGRASGIAESQLDWEE
jgi:hypothetical protein